MHTKYRVLKNIVYNNELFCSYNVSITGAGTSKKMKPDGEAAPMVPERKKKSTVDPLKPRACKKL